MGLLKQEACEAKALGRGPLFGGQLRLGSNSKRPPAKEPAARVLLTEFQGQKFGSLRAHTANYHPPDLPKPLNKGIEP